MVELLDRIVGGADDEAVHTAVLHHAALEAAGLRPRAVALDRGQIAERILHAFELLVLNQGLGNDIDGIGRVLDGRGAKGAMSTCCAWACMGSRSVGAAWMETCGNVIVSWSAAAAS